MQNLKYIILLNNLELKILFKINYLIRLEVIFSIYLKYKNLVFNN